MKNRSAIELILLILVFLSSCQTQEKSEKDNSNKVLPYPERYTYLTDTADTRWLAEPFAKFWQPTDSQKKVMENLAIQHIATHSEPGHTKLRNEPFGRYYRQYIAYVSQEGDSILNINADCLLWGYDNPNWELFGAIFSNSSTGTYNKFSLPGANAGISKLTPMY